MAESYLAFERYLQSLQRAVSTDEFDKLMREAGSFEEIRASIIAVKRTLQFLPPEEATKLRREIGSAEEALEILIALKRIIKREEKWAAAWSIAVLFGKYLGIVCGFLVVIWPYLRPIVREALGFAP